MLMCVVCVCVSRSALYSMIHSSGNFSKERKISNRSYGVKNNFEKLATHIWISQLKITCSHNSSPFDDHSHIVSSRFSLWTKKLSQFYFDVFIFLSYLLIIQTCHNYYQSCGLISQAPNRMTFQLVLPPQFGVIEDPHGFEANNNITRRSRPPSRQGSILESKSPGFVNTRLVNYNRGVSHQPSILSQRTEQHHKNHPPPSTEEEKSKMTRFGCAKVQKVKRVIKM